jgi:hypothetical protein
LEQMEQLPKIVAQRLQAVSRTETHPDANLLAAFTEKSLLPLEQTQILEHLAGCAECRDVVAHAQPEQVLQQVAGAAAPLPVRRSWFSGAKLRWAALAACVVVVGAVVISRARFTQNAPMARSQSAPAVVAKTETQPLLNPAPTEERKSNTDNESESNHVRLKMSVGTKRDGDEVSAAQELQAADSLSPLRAKQRQPERRSPELAEKNNNAPAVTNGIIMGRTASPPAVPPQSTVTAQPEDAKSTKKEFSADKAMKAPAATNEVAQAQPAPPPPAPAAKSAPVLADSQLQKGESGNLGAFYKAKDGYLGAGASAGTLAAFRGANPRWQLSADGKLIKSSDAGKSWQTVPVGDKVVFRALCVTGSEVWVGGAQGNLFYSSDAGQQWEQVIPTSAGRNLTADIAAIEFKDPQHGKITTTDHQSWITSDGGHAWQIETR